MPSEHGLGARRPPYPQVCSQAPLFEHDVGLSEAPDGYRIAPMTQRVLVTGGAGFIGSHLIDELLAREYEVRVIDSLEPQGDGPSAHEPGYRPEYLHGDAELVVGNVGDP